MKQRGPDRHGPEKEKESRLAVSHKTRRASMKRRQSTVSLLLRGVNKVLGCMACRFGSVPLSNLYAGESKEVGAKVTHWGRRTCFHLD